MIGLSKWYNVFESNPQKSDSILMVAKQLAMQLTDKSFYLNVMDLQKELLKEKGDFKAALIINEQIVILKDSIKNWEDERLTKNLEIQFEIAEKDRSLLLVKKEHKISKLTNSLLITALLFLGLITWGIVSFYRKINKRDQQLIHTKEELVKATEQQKLISEQKMQNELEFKESQLNAMTIQMVQKNDLLLELKEKLESSKSDMDGSISKIISKSLSQEKEWDDFNKSFESINKNFYSRIIKKYPDISPNELKICALMKMNLNTKDMASILKHFT